MRALILVVPFATLSCADSAPGARPESGESAASSSPLTGSDGTTKPSPESSEQSNDSSAGHTSSDGDGTPSRSPVSATSSADDSAVTASSSDLTASASNESSTHDTSETAAAPMRGAVSLHVEPLGDCSLGDAWFDYPIVEGGHPVTATEHGTLSDDNGPGAPGRPLHVTCEWLTVGEPYRLVTGIDAYLGEDRRTASLSPVLEASKANTGSFTFSTTDGGPAWAASGETRCEYTLIEMDEAKQSVWGRITCSSLAYRDGTESCQITEGYFYFEGCRPRML